MKRFLSLSLMALLAAGTIINAQSRKSWDFAAGVSDADRINLDADKTNWSATAGSDGVTTSYWADLTKMSGELKANGVVLDYTRGLIIGTAGLSKSNNFKYGPTAFRITRNNETINLPRLANGQKVTVLARSANGTATNRGLKGNDNMQYISGPDGGIVLGNQVEGSEGTYTLVWEVQTSSADSVDAAIIAITGGVDIQSITIDNGDEPEIVEDPNVAYLYAGDIDDDLFRQAAGLDDYATVTDISLADISSGSVTSDDVEAYDVVVLGQSFVESLTDDVAAVVSRLIRRVPILNFTPSAQLGYEGVATQAKAVKIGEDYLDAALFAELELSGDDGDELAIYSDAYDEEQPTLWSYTLSEASPFAKDETLATIDGAAALHQHGTRNAYLFLPIVCASTVTSDLNLSDAGVALISNAVKLLQSTKAEVLTASKPTVTVDYQNGVSYVTLKASITDAAIHYLIAGEGADPEDLASYAVYAEAITISEPATIYAYATAPGYNNSAVVSSAIDVKRVLDVPTIAVEGAEGSSTITLSAVEGASVYYSFNGQTAVDRSSLYAEPIVVTESCTITCFTAGDGYLPSETVSSDVFVSGIPAAKDTLAHFDCNATDWYENAIVTVGGEALTFQASIDAGIANYSSNACYYYGKNPWSFYGTEVDHTEVVTDEEGNEQEVTVYKEDPNSLRTVTSTSDTDWILKSNCQVFTGEVNLTNIDYVKAPGAGAGRYLDSAVDAIGGVATKGALTFGKAGDKVTGRIESTVAFAAPFDVVVYSSQGSGDGKTFTVAIEVSADGEAWTEIGQVGFSLTQRHTKKTRVHYEGSDLANVYVRVRQISNGEKAQICDIYVIATGGLTGIETLRAETPAAAACYDLTGRRISQPASGLYIEGGRVRIVR